MSKTHIVKSGETLTGISVKYYGTYSKWTSIRDANPQLANRKKAVDGSPLIFPNDKLLIPQDSTRAASTVSDTPVVMDEYGDQEISIYIDGKLYTGFTGYTLQEPMDGFAAFSFSTVWDDEDNELRKAFKPFVYKECAVYFSGNLVFKGSLLMSAPEVTSEAKVLTIQGYPVCGALNDCHIPATKYPLSYSDMTLKEIADDICEPFGVKCEFPDGAGDSFKRVEAENDETVLDFLSGLGSQRGLFYTNTSDGALCFFKPSVQSTTVTYKEGQLPFISCRPQFDSQKLYSHITGYTKTDLEGDSASYTYENKYLIDAGVFRPYSFVSNDADEGNLEDIVKAKAAQMIFSACKYELRIVGCTDSDGNKLEKGMSVSVYSPGAMIYKETKFVVSEIKIVRSDTEGVQSTLQLVLPESLSGNFPEVLPWEE